MPLGCSEQGAPLIAGQKEKGTVDSNLQISLQKALKFKVRCQAAPLFIFRAGADL